MEVLSLDIEGKFAHFRKFHGNNTAMSYSIPPRTTIIGILAAIMGEPKDSYYVSFRHENLKIGIRVLSDLKKSFHRLNYLKITGSGDFGGKNGRIQTPFEVVTGHDLKSGMVTYRIYISAGLDDTVYQFLKKSLTNSERRFNISLGVAGFSAFISKVQVLEGTKLSGNSDWLLMHSACNSDEVDEIDFPDDAEFRFNHIEEELLPADFIGGEQGRELFRMNRVLFATKNFPMRVILNGDYYRLEANGSVENIQFLEYAGVFT
ncbi:CRISPR-associated protein Cas5 [Algoriphagus sp. NG3]|uniref:CRISPR-associated protein Cas5 n=1 Tax=Algoriphagus sp. NG3 TaxID=3097546 RepID=UPI002A82A198|nr:CRISPR-associated protein Cas5 [Algoriphagus sp. NG3]WPR77956.1 CRISPR-associated protein Cas5 [Algoriphagus sp. NG3]